MIRTCTFIIFRKFLFSTTLLIVGVSGCGSAPRPPASLGDQHVLEQLARSFQFISEQYNQAPAGLPPDERKIFIERVFKHAGFDYSGTLHLLAQTVGGSTDKTRRDLAELVLFPQRNGTTTQQMYKIFDAQQLEDIGRITVIYDRPSM